MTEKIQTDRMSARHIMVVVAACGMLGAMASIANMAGLFFTPLAEALDVGRGSISLPTTSKGLI